MSKRKKIQMLVTVSVPDVMTAAEARREVRTLITHQTNWHYDEGDVKALAVAAVKRAKKPVFRPQKRRALVL